MEDQRTEWKETWKDDCLKTICGFANAEGGVMTIGVDDNGSVVGVEDPETLLKQIPDKIRSRTGIVPFVRLDTAEPPYTISILVEKSSSPVYLDGRLFRRSGSTTQLVSGPELEAAIIGNAGSSWTEYPVEGVSVYDLSPDAIREFRNLSRTSRRLTPEEAELPAEDLLSKLDLMVDGKLKRAAVLMFHPDPGRILGPTYVKIGMFDGPELLYFDEISGPLIFQVGRVVDTLSTKYMIRPVTYKGIVRTELNPYPMKAIREAVLNAIVHNDYSSGVPIQIKVTKDSLAIYNEGGLPPGWTIDSLMTVHRSRPRNRSLAEAFFRSGFIESFGRGIDLIMSQYEGRPEFRPTFEDNAGFCVKFRNEAVFEFPGTVSEGAVDKSVMAYLESLGSGSYDEIEQATGLSHRQVQRTIKSLVETGRVAKGYVGRRVVFRISDDNP